MNNFLVIQIKKIISENSETKTFCFQRGLMSKAGQFVMLWVPGIGQKPFSITYDNGNEFWLTILQRGQVTRALFELKAGDYVGIAGPYGTNFSIDPNFDYIAVAGGYGVAPLRLFAEQAALVNIRIDFCLGAKNQDSLILVNYLKKIPGLKLFIATDDGSKGYHGYVTELLPQLLATDHKIKNVRKKKVVVCGPELMGKAALDLCNYYHTACEISIERYIKCGVGVCGQCAVDGLGICLCKEGPVVSRHIANQITEFGYYARDKSGQKYLYEKK